MSNCVSQSLNLFDALPGADKQSAVVAIIRRSPPGEDDTPVNGFDGLADELFAAPDAEENTRADH